MQSEGIAPAELNNALEYGTVLVVDDHKTIRNLLAERLRNAGFKVMLARSGREALARLRSQLADIAVLDIMMKDDGIETAAKISELYPAADIIFLTAFDNDSNRSRAWEAGVRAVQWIDKEIDWIKNAALAVSQAMERKRLAAYLTKCLKEVRKGYSDVAHRYFSWNKLRGAVLNNLWDTHESLEEDKYRRQLADQLTQAVARIESHQLLPSNIDVIEKSLQRLFSTTEIGKSHIRELEKAWRANRVETLPSFRRILAKWEELYDAEEDEEEGTTA